MFTNEELKRFFLIVHPEYLQLSTDGVYKWKSARAFTAILFPDDIEKDIFECCVRFGSPSCLSPLHDSDFRRDTGELITPHYHFLCTYKKRTTLYKFYSDVFDVFGDLPLSSIDVVNDIAAYLRYFCYSNNPEKIRYNKEDIKDFNLFHSSYYLS